MFARSFNPLKGITELFPNREPEIMTKHQFDTFVELMRKGGIKCSAVHDAVRVLEVLDKENFIKLEFEDDGTGKYIKVGNLYNGS